MEIQRKLIVMPKINRQRQKPLTNTQHKIAAYSQTPNKRINTYEEISLMLEKTQLVDQRLDSSYDPYVLTSIAQRRKRLERFSIDQTKQMNKKLSPFRTPQNQLKLANISKIGPIMIIKSKNEEQKDNVLETNKNILKNNIQKIMDESMKTTQRDSNTSFISSKNPLPYEKLYQKIKKDREHKTRSKTLGHPNLIEGTVKAKFEILFEQNNIWANQNANKSQRIYFQKPMVRNDKPPMKLSQNQLTMPYYINAITNKSVDVVAPQYFLPPEQYPDSYTLVLDLDETLVHFQEIGQLKQILVRPYVEQFLREMSGIFEIVIFTAGMENYANWVIQQIDPKGYIRFRLYRQHTKYVVGENHYIKDLTRLGRSLSRTIIIDNISQNYSLQPLNGIQILSWFDDPNDKALLELIPFLKTIIGSDVREIIHNHQQKINKVI